MAVYFLRFARHLFFRNRLPATGFQKLSARLRGHGLTTNSPTEHLQTVQDVSAEDTLIANKVRLQAAGILLSIQVDPDTEVQGWRGTARHASHPTWPALSNGELEEDKGDADLKGVPSPDPGRLYANHLPQRRGDGR